MEAVVRERRTRWVMLSVETDDYGAHQYEISLRYRAHCVQGEPM